MKLWHWLCFLILLLEDHCSILKSWKWKRKWFSFTPVCKTSSVSFSSGDKNLTSSSCFDVAVMSFESNERFLTDLLCAPLIQVCGLHIELETQLQSWIPQDPESQDSFSYMKGSKKAVQMMRMCNCMIPEEMWILFSKQAIFYSKNMNNTNCWL